MGNENIQSSFIEGFCWNNILNPEARLLKVKIKGASVNDVGSMSLMPFKLMPSAKYFTAILNSNILFDFYREFINCSVNIQINDIRLLPIIIPNDEELSHIEMLVSKAIICRKSIDNYSDNDSSIGDLESIEYEIDKLVESIYLI